MATITVRNCDRCNGEIQDVTPHNDSFRFTSKPVDRILCKDSKVMDAYGNKWNFNVAIEVSGETSITQKDICFNCLREIVRDTLFSNVIWAEGQGKDY